jgi:hypothetical protein
MAKNKIKNLEKKVANLAEITDILRKEVENS